MDDVSFGTWMSAQAPPVKRKRVYDNAPSTPTSNRATRAAPSKRVKIGSTTIDLTAEEIDYSANLTKATTTVRPGKVQAGKAKGTKAAKTSASDGVKKPNAKPRKLGEEKRLSRFRAKVPQSYHDYYERAMTQRMFVLDRRRTCIHECPHGPTDCPSEEVDLAGSTGNVYTITITHKPHCTCPNFAKGNPQCKHIVYVLVKVLKAPAELGYQLAFLTNELHEIFNHAGPLPADTVEESDKNGRRHAVEGDCAICCEDLNPDGEEVVWCKAACGNNLHKTCFDQWAATKGHGNVTCPYCRTPWQQCSGGDLKTIGKTGQVGAEGYVNVAAELGISGRRDYSTYHPAWIRSQYGRRY